MHKLKEKMHEHQAKKQHEKLGDDNTAYGSTAYGSGAADNVQVVNAPAGTPVRVVVSDGGAVSAGTAAPMATSDRDYNDRSDYNTSTMTNTGYGTSGTAVNAREFTEVEDRAVEKERVERVVEHVPVEKHFVTETRAVGENTLPGTVESQGVTEREVGAYGTANTGYGTTDRY